MAGLIDGIGDGLGLNLGGNNNDNETPTPTSAGDNIIITPTASPENNLGDGIISQNPIESLVPTGIPAVTSAPLATESDASFTTTIGASVPPSTSTGPSTTSISTSDLPASSAAQQTASPSSIDEVIAITSTYSSGSSTWVSTTSTTTPIPMQPTSGPASTATTGTAHPGPQASSSPQGQEDGGVNNNGSSSEAQPATTGTSLLPTPAIIGISAGVGSLAFTLTMFFVCRRTWQRRRWGKDGMERLDDDETGRAVGGSGMVAGERVGTADGDNSSSGGSGGAWREGLEKFHGPQDPGYLGQGYRM